MHVGPNMSPGCKMQRVTWYTLTWWRQRKLHWDSSLLQDGSWKAGGNRDGRAFFPCSSLKSRPLTCGTSRNHWTPIFAWSDLRCNMSWLKGMGEQPKIGGGKTEQRTPAKGATSLWDWTFYELQGGKTRPEREEVQRKFPSQKSSIVRKYQSRNFCKQLCI